MKRLSTLQTQQTFKQMKKSTSFSGISYNSSQETSKVFYDTILKCPICQAKVRNAHMCPNCCKLFCQICIKNWVVTSKPECPNCMKGLRLISIVNCQHLGKQIEEAITRNESQSKLKTPQLSSSMIQTSTHSLSTQLSRSNVIINSSSQYLSPMKSLQLIENKRICKQHDLKLDYYCQECRIGLCPDCAVLTEKHRGHRLSKLLSKEKQLRDQKQQIRAKILEVKDQLKGLKDEILKKKARIKNIELQKVNYLFSYIKKIQDIITSQFNFCLHSREEKFQGLKDKFQVAMNKINIVQKQMGEMIPTKLIKSQSTIKQQLSSLQLSNVCYKTPEIPYLNFFSPEFQTKTFLLQNFTRQKTMNSVIYTQIFEWEGIQWRLRIYPNGRQSSPDPFISIYLEMHQTAIKIAKYWYKIEIVNQLDNLKRISRTSENQFQSGTYWGYDKFAKYSSLHQQKYLNSLKDCLRIDLSIKFSAYPNAIYLKNSSINQKYCKFDSNMGKIQELKRKLGIQEDRQKISNVSEDKIPVEKLIDERRPHSFPSREYSHHQNLIKQF